MFDENEKKLGGRAGQKTREEEFKKEEEEKEPAVTWQTPEPHRPFTAQPPIIEPPDMTRITSPPNPTAESRL